MNTKEIFETFNQLGTYSATAKELGIDPRTVRRHVNKYHKDNSFAAQEATRTGTPFNRISHYWLKTKNEEGDDVSLFVKNGQEAMEYDELRDRLIKDLESYAPKPPKIYRPSRSEDDHLLILDPADIHLGKLAVVEETNGESYNIDIAYRRAFMGVGHLLNKASNHNVGQIVIVVGNDILHIDNPKRTTTSGTPQDTYGQWWEMFEAARNLYVDIIELAKTFADVTLVYCPSNHDYALGFTLMDSLYSWYRNDPNVTVSDYAKSIRHRKYIRYGNNLIGFTHGDGAKNKDLTTLMQFEAKNDWSQVKYSYWYIHHLHHKFRLINSVEVEKDYTGVTVIGSYGDIGENISQIECIRSPSPADSWHSRNGYVNMQAIEAFLHHPTDGQVARFTSYC